MTDYYLKQYTKEASEETEFINAPEVADEFIGAWLLEHHDKANWDRRVRITIAFVPTSEEIKEADADREFDEENN